MNKNNLKSYAPQARKDFIAAVTARANMLGLSDDGGTLKVAEANVSGDVAIIAGREWPAKVEKQRLALVKKMQASSFAQTVEAVAYTWFNRFVALRYMELHDYLDHGFRVLSSTTGNMPEVLGKLTELQLHGLNIEYAKQLKLAGNKEGELYSLILIAQCNVLSNAMPFLFEQIDDETELLLPDNLLLTDSIIAKLVKNIPEQDWAQVEIIGWLYQFYISEKKDEVIGKVVKSEDIPAATQLFTPNWIVQYMVQNSVGRLWTLANPSSTIHSQWPYYIKPAEQTAEVNGFLQALIDERIAQDGTTLNPESITMLDPACGSGHILVEAYECLKQIYLERGYQPRAIPRLILEKNLFGLDIDDRAAQLAGFALLMKARADDRRILQEPPQLNIYSLQESKGLNADQLAQSLSSFGVNRNTMAELLNTFAHAKTFGSLIKIKPALATQLPNLKTQLDIAIKASDLFAKESALQLLPLVQQADLLARQYDAVVANPPYINIRNMQLQLRQFVESNYPNLCDDLFSAFVERASSFSKSITKLGFVTPFTWMYLTSYEQFRKHIIANHSLSSLIQLEYNAFEPACVPICSFVCDSKKINDLAGVYIDLSDFKGYESQPVKTIEGIKNPNSYWVKKFNLDSFTNVPNQIFCLGLSDLSIQAICTGNTVSKYANPKQGIKTGDNSKFLRFWWEVDQKKSFFPESNTEIPLNLKWYPIQKGGKLRRWYGNNLYLINWESDGNDLKNFKDDNGKLRSRPQNLEFRFKEGLTWSTLTVADFSMRYCQPGFLSESAGSMCYPKVQKNIFYLLGFFCSSTFNYFIRATSPTLSYSEGAVARAPIIFNKEDEVTDLTKKAIEISKEDWDLNETSWGFSRNALTEKRQDLSNCKTAFENFNNQCIIRTALLTNLEEQINKIFLQIFDLNLNINFDGYGKKPNLNNANSRVEACNLVSNAIGCMMGRYSLDEPGLIYAHAGNEGFDARRYNTFPADADGIVPITDTAWFEDDATNRIAEFLVAVWGKPTLDENLAWLAESLGGKTSDLPLEVIRKYLSNQFYKDHLQTYKKRPIYWHFSSGKQGAFQALVYLHRYNEGTLARMRSEYVVPLIGKLKSRIEMLEKDTNTATSTAARNKLNKEIEQLNKKQFELQTYDEKLRHYADMRIQLDLDDGVKVNYGKFGDLLSDVKAITGGSDD